MFNNFINIHDFFDLISRIQQDRNFINSLFDKIFSSQSNKIKSTWSNVGDSNKSWWNIPAVQQRWNFLISGNQNINYQQYILNKYFEKNVTAISLGCGTGQREIEWAKLGNFKQIDAYDISASRIELARKMTESLQMNNLNFVVGNIYEIDFSDIQYDIVFFEGSLHHFSPVQDILLKAKMVLKPDGYLIVNEFIGPTRFQWTDRQIECINNLLAILPTKYRVLENGKSLKSKIFRPSRLRMKLGDPSEAIESSNICPCLSEHFNIVERKNYGGTILHMLLNGIAHHFIENNFEAQQWLQICFEIEDLLMKEGEIESDYAIFICKNK